VDHNKAQKLCLEAQRYYESHKIKTQVLPASLTSTDEILQLAGVHHITMAPALLRQLSESPAHSLKTTSLFDDTDDIASTLQPYPLLLLGDKEPEYRIAFTRSGNGEGERKLSQVRDHEVEYMA
jgi:transaldolase